MLFDGEITPWVFQFVGWWGARDEYCGRCRKDSLSSKSGSGVKQSPQAVKRKARDQSKEQSVGGVLRSVQNWSDQSCRESVLLSFLAVFAPGIVLLRIICLLPHWHLCTYNSSSAQMSPSKKIPERKSYGKCARSECQTTNVSGIPRIKENTISKKLEDFGLKLQTACSAQCHEELERDIHERYQGILDLATCHYSVQSACSGCHIMVSTGSQTIYRGVHLRAWKPLSSRKTLCGACRTIKLGNVL